MGSSRDVRRLVTLEVHTDLLPTAKKIFNCIGLEPIGALFCQSGFSFRAIEAWLRVENSSPRIQLEFNRDVFTFCSRQLDVVEETGGLIREPIITICELSDYAQGFDEKDKRQYVEKLVPIPKYLTVFDNEPLLRRTRKRDFDFRSAFWSAERNRMLWNEQLDP
ncbi:hypothetical protein OUZ56_029797 [Daphnia magna]|uniref:Uncharacterized protein n=1 Tax=Daphnia magna TaxID=35525 RepID=A0ABR0B7V0_9CRUS|nr:hypothetical protein OUZ56_029797 [Daphnia magna]